MTNEVDNSDLSVPNSLYVTKNLQVNGNSFIHGNMNLSGPLTVDGALQINGPIVPTKSSLNTGNDALPAVLNVQGKFKNQNTQQSVLVFPRRFQVIFAVNSL